DLACLFIRPRPGSERASVGVVSGTGPIGMRLSQRVPYFLSGVGVPDWIVLGPEAMETGVGGIRGTGFFGNDWGLSNDDSAWRPEGTPPEAPKPEAAKPEAPKPEAPKEAPKEQPKETPK